MRVTKDILAVWSLLLIVLWTAAVGGSLAWNWHMVQQTMLGHGRSQARGNFNKDLVFRRWSASHGGVYVPISERTPPNPYLSHMPNRDVTTTEGLKLTLVNPAYMTRQVHEMGVEQYGWRGHITSLEPIRPENAPDPWEAKALKAFQAGTLSEVSELVEMEGEPYMRFMRPLMTEEACLKCHGSQGYKVGDIRGGISISVPMAWHIAEARRSIRSLVVGHFLIWSLGCFGILYGLKERKRLEAGRHAAEMQMLEVSRLVSLGQLAAGVAHEINQPLTYISGTVQNLAIDIKEDTVDLQETGERLGVCRRQIARIVQIIDHLRLFGRQQPEKRVAVDVQAVLQDCLLLMHQRIRLKNVELNVHAEEGLPRVHGNGQRLEQVFLNLIQNAVDALEGGQSQGGRIDVDFGVSEGGRAVRITFKDNGEGIEPEHLKRIFDPFFSTKSVGKGTGLGLSIVYGIVQEHNGSIQCHSVAGEGTTFTLTLPVFQNSESLPDQGGEAP